MKHAVCAAIMAAGLAAGGQAQAQDWAQQKAELIAAAEKEGALSLYSQPNLAAREYISKAWAATFEPI